MSYTSVKALRYNRQDVVRLWNTADYDTYRQHTVTLLDHDRQQTIGTIEYTDVLLPKKGCIASYLQSLNLDVYGCTTDAFEAMVDSRGQIITWVDSIVRESRLPEHKGIMTLELDALMCRAEGDIWLYPQSYGVDVVPAGLTAYYTELGFLNRGELWCLKK